MNKTLIILSELTEKIIIIAALFLIASILLFTFSHIFSTIAVVSFILNLLAQICGGVFIVFFVGVILIGIMKFMIKNN
jgi:hypothetical protein